MRRKRIGLLVEGPEVVGGIQSAAHRHLRLMRGDFEVVPIAFETSRDERLWAGRRERIPDFGGAAWRVTASDLKSDNALTAGSSMEHLRHDMRFRSFADHLIALVETERLDLLHAFGLFHQRGLLAGYAAAKAGIPYLLSFRGVDLETRLFDEKSLPALHASLLGAAGVVCVSEDSRRLLERLFKPACPTYVVRNSLDPAAFRRGKVSLPLLQGRRLPVVGCFGKFRRVTGLDFLLKAFERLSRRRPAVLLLAGGLQKREVEYYNGLIDSLACGPSIVRVGHVPHEKVLDYMALCDAVAVPSVSDACPNKVLEAMYARVPLAATRAGGIPELARDGKDALLVPAREAEPLAEALETLLARPALGRRLAASAYRRVTAEFTPEKERPLWTEVYRRSL